MASFNRFPACPVFPPSVSAGEEESLRLPVGHGGAGVRGPDGRRLYHHCVRKQHEQQRLRHRHAARQPLQRPLLSEVSDSTFRKLSCAQQTAFFVLCESSFPPATITHIHTHSNLSIFKSAACCHLETKVKPSSPVFSWILGPGWILKHHEEIEAPRRVFLVPFVPDLGFTQQQANTDVHNAGLQILKDVL